jgi:hypothetical protein
LKGSNAYGRGLIPQSGTQKIVETPELLTNYYPVAKVSNSNKRGTIPQNGSQNNVETPNFLTTYYPV